MEQPNVVKLIRMARHQLVVRRAGNYKTWINTELDNRWVGARANWKVQGDPVKAFIQRSSWVAKCPEKDCNEQVIVDIDEPFYCPNCQNIRNGGFARPVSFPENREDIERVLLARAIPDTRNWKLSETIDDLKLQNIEHGEGVE